MGASGAYDAELESYRELARTRASETDGEAFLNRHAEHAWIIVELLFRKATESVEILSGSLNPSIYGDERVIASAMGFLDRCLEPVPFQPSLFVLVENNGDWPTHPLISRVLNYFPTKLEVRRVPPEVRNAYDFHFMLADKRHFRCKKSRQLPEAVVRFNSTETGESLHNLFQQVRMASEIIQLGA